MQNFQWAIIVTLLAIIAANTTTGLLQYLLFGVAGGFFVITIIELVD